MKPDNRTHLAAMMPCGCCAIITTTDSPDGPMPFKASAADIADFYKEVHKKQTRKKNPLVLEVVTVKGRPEIKMGCEICNPQHGGK